MKKLILENYRFSDENLFIVPVQSTDFDYSAPELQRLLDIYNRREKNLWEIGIEYERYIGYTLEQDGWQVVYNGAVNGSGDGGIDLICFKEQSTLIVQCKRWQSKVTEHEITKFYTALLTFSKRNFAHGSISAYFYTTSDYNERAYKTAEYYGIKCKIIKFNGIVDYPPVKCIRFNEQAIYFLPFDEDFDGVKLNAADGDCYKFSVAEAVQAGYNYYKNPPRKSPQKNSKTADSFKKNPPTRLSRSTANDDVYWQGNKSYPYAYFHSGYWEYVDLKSCRLISRNAEGYSFIVNFIGVLNNIPPKVVKLGTVTFRQKINNRPEFYDDEKHMWITLPAKRKMLEHEGLAQYISAQLPFRNNMFSLAYQQLFNRDYADP